MKLILLSIFAACAFGQTSINILSIIPTPTDSAVGEIRLREKRANGVNYIGFKSPVAVSANVIWQLPGADSAGCFSSDGSGVVTIVACSGSGTLPVDSNTTIVYDHTDPTKQVGIAASQITTGFTRYIFMPDYDLFPIGQYNYAYSTAYTGLSFIKSRGTLAAPLKALDGDAIFQMYGWGENTDGSAAARSGAGLIRMDVKTNGTDYGGQTIIAAYDYASRAHGLLLDKDGNILPYNPAGGSTTLGSSSSNYAAAYVNQYHGYNASPAIFHRAGRADPSSLEFLWTGSASNGLWLAGVEPDWTNAALGGFYINHQPLGATAAFEIAESGAIRMGYSLQAGSTISTTSGGFNAAGGTYKITGTTIIDASKNASFNNLTLTGTCTGCGGGGGGGMPNSVLLSDYTGFDACNGDIASGFAAAVAAIDAIGGGTLIVPAGKWCSSSKLQITFDRITIQGVSTGAFPGCIGCDTRSASVLGWYTAPGTPTPLVEFWHTKAGGMKDITIMASPLITVTSGSVVNELANTRILRLVNASFGYYENVNGERWTNGPAMELTTDGAAHVCKDGRGGSVNTSGTSVTLVGGTDSSYFLTNWPANMPISINGVIYAISSVTNNSALVLTTSAGTQSSVAYIGYCAPDVGSSGNVFNNVSFSYVGDSQEASGILLDGAAGGTGVLPNLCACSNLFTGGTVHYSKNGSTTYGVYLRYADNNHFTRTFIGAGGGDHATARPAVYWDQYIGDTQFPLENTFDAVSLGVQNGAVATQSRTGAAGTAGGNWMVLNASDCGGYTACTPAVDYVSGIVDGRLFGTVNTPPAVSWAADDSTNTVLLKLDQWSGSYNNGGSIGFFRQGGLYGKIGYRITSGAGMGFYTGTSAGTITERWRITDTGNLWPVVSGGSTLLGGQDGFGTWHVPFGIYSMSYNAYTTTSGTTAASPQQHLWQADSKINFFLDSYNSATADDSPFIFFRRARGSSAFPSTVSASDRIGGFAWFMGTGSSPLSSGPVGARLAVYAVAGGGGGGIALPTEMRFAVTNTSGGMSDVMTLGYNFLNATALNPSFGVINATGSPAYRVGGLTVIDASRNISTAHVNPIASATYNLGSVGTEYANVFSNSFSAYVSGVLRFQAAGTITLNNSGGTDVFTVSNTGTLSAANTVSATNGFVAGGNFGVNASVVVACGTLTFTLGILTNNGTCP